MSISSYLDADYFRQMDQFKSLLPVPQTQEEINGKTAFSLVLPNYILQEDPQSPIHHAWHRLYSDAVANVAKMAMGIEEYIAIRMTPVVSPMMDEPHLRLTVITDVFMVPTREFHIPTIIHDPVTFKPIEWRCGHCTMPNPMTARYCGEMHKHAAGCGAPRAKLIQEFPTSERSW